MTTRRQTGYRLKSAPNQREKRLDDGAAAAAVDGARKQREKRNEAEKAKTCQPTVKNNGAE